MPRVRKAVNACDFAHRKGEMKTIYIKSVYGLSENEVRRVLGGAFAHFGSLTPVAEIVISTMLDFLQSDVTAISRLSEVLESRCAFEYEGPKVVTIVTQTSKTRISLVSSEQGKYRYSLLVGFGDEGSDVRAQQVREIFKDVLISFDESVLHPDGSVHEIMGR